jgi:methionine biosynthesis protein MetW
MSILLRSDLAIIAGHVAAKARVIDIGCGDGALLDHLVQHRHCDGRGMEISPAGVAAAIAKGLSVIQGDADTDLSDFPDSSFDVAILSQTLQATHRPADVLDHLLRIANRAIVSFPNFAYWRGRLSVAVHGKMPVTKALPVEWYETANIHLCTVQDFQALCAAKKITVERAVYLRHGAPVSARFANIFAEQAIFMLAR